jgi:hypothetical protein
MSDPTSEPVHQHRVNRAAAARVGLFSHTPGGEVVEHRRRLVGDGVDWRATPFSAGRYHGVAFDDEDQWRQSAGHRRVSRTQGAAGGT